MKGKTFEKMRQQLEGNRFIGEKHFVEPLRQVKEKVSLEARAWAKDALRAL